MILTFFPVIKKLQKLTAISEIREEKFRFSTQASNGHGNWKLGWNDIFHVMPTVIVHVRMCSTDFPHTLDLVPEINKIANVKQVLVNAECGAVLIIICSYKNYFFTLPRIRSQIFFTNYWNRDGETVAYLCSKLISSGSQSSCRKIVNNNATMMMIMNESSNAKMKILRCDAESCLTTSQNKKQQEEKKEGIGNEKHDTICS